MVAVLAPPPPPVPPAKTLPPGAAITLTVLAVYVTLMLLGVFILRLQVFVDAVCRGTDDARGVALTFDDGPCPINTPKVLDMLDR